MSKSMKSLIEAVMSQGHLTIALEDVNIEELRSEEVRNHMRKSGIAAGLINNQISFRVAG